MHGVLTAKRRTALVLFALAASLSGVVGCGEQSLESPSQASQAVLYGQPSGPEDDGMAMIWASTSTRIGICTASVIAPNLVVTALHCVSNFVDQPFGCTVAGDLTPGSSGGQLGATVDPSTLSVRAGVGPDATVVAKGLQVFGTQTPSICRNDVAIVLLDRNVDLPVVPLRLLTGTIPGERMRMVGYGRDENDVVNVRHARPGMIIAQVGSSPFRPAGDPVPPRTLVTNGPAGCNGDSGGPLISTHGAITGVYSQVAGNCEDANARDFFTEIAPFYDDVVAPAFAAANAQPVFEDLSDAGGATGDGGVPDAGMEPTDADTDAAADSGSPDDDAGALPYHGPRKTGGCTCRAAPASGSSAYEPLLALPFLLLTLRRRRRAVAGT
jgi:MYXO-CTERM domain-containing protein